MKIALDAGHGLHTAGKRTPSGVREWTLNTTIVEAMEKEFKNYKGVTTVRLDDPTGQVDVPMEERTNKANREKVDALISVHHNSFRGVMGDHGGTETWVQDRASESLASVVQESVLASLGLRNRGVKGGNLHMNRESNAISVLVEVGFMDSNTDTIILNSDKRAEVGFRLAQDVARHYNLVRVETPVVKPTPAPLPPVSTPHKVVAETGNVFVLEHNVFERNNPKLSDISGLNRRKKGEKIEYNAYTITDGHNWVRQLNGKWVPWRETGGEKFGYIEAKKAVVKPKPAPVKNKPSGNWKAEKGTFILHSGVYERNQPDTSNRAGLKLIPAGTKVPYDAYQMAQGYVWLRKVSDGKVIPWRVYNGEKWGVIV